jgi:hypothetical protein
MANNKNFLRRRRFSSSESLGSPTRSDSELEMFTARDLERLLKIDVRTICGYVNRRVIPYVKIESNVWFPKRRIFDWVEQHTYLPKSTTKHEPGQR